MIQLYSPNRAATWITFTGEISSVLMDKWAFDSTHSAFVNMIFSYGLEVRSLSLSNAMANISKSAASAEMLQSGYGMEVHSSPTVFLDKRSWISVGGLLLRCAECLAIGISEALSLRYSLTHFLYQEQQLIDLHLVFVYLFIFLPPFMASEIQNSLSSSSNNNNLYFICISTGLLPSISINWKCAIGLNDRSIDRSFVWGKRWESNEIFGHFNLETSNFKMFYFISSPRPSPMILSRNWFLPITDHHDHHLLPACLSVNNSPTLP